MSRVVKWLIPVLASVYAPFGLATILTFSVPLLGSEESPPNASPGTGDVTVEVDTTGEVLTVDMSFSGLLGTTTVSHIHCCTASPVSGVAGVATQLPTFSGFPIGVTSGTYMHSFDLTDAATYNPAFVTANGGTVAGAEATLIAGLLDGRAYFNLHTTVFPAGELRGFLVPEPGTLLLVLACLAAAAWARRKDAWHRGSIHGSAMRRVTASPGDGVWQART